MRPYHMHVLFSGTYPPPQPGTLYRSVHTTFEAPPTSLHIPSLTLHGPDPWDSKDLQL